MNNYLYGSLIACLLCFGFSSQASAEPVRLFDSVNNCELFLEFPHVPTLKNYSIRWSGGRCSDGKISGAGKVEFLLNGQNKHILEGTFSDGYIEGAAKHLIPNLQWSFEGTFARSKLNGKYVFRGNGYELTSEWRDGEIIGGRYSTAKAPDGTYCPMPEVRAGKFHGFGCWVRSKSSWNKFISNEPWNILDVQSYKDGDVLSYGYHINGELAEVCASESQCDQARAQAWFDKREDRKQAYLLAEAKRKEEDDRKAAAAQKEADRLAEVARKDAERQERERQAAAAAAAAEQKRKDQAAAEEERQYRALFNRKGDPQAIYLRAGKFEREGRADRAKELYEFLVDSFASSTWAVKANDRLLSLTMASAPSKGSTQESRRPSSSQFLGHRYTLKYQGELVLSGIVSQANGDVVQIDVKRVNSGRLGVANCTSMAGNRYCVGEKYWLPSSSRDFADGFSLDIERPY